MMKQRLILLMTITLVVCELHAEEVSPSIMNDTTIPINTTLGVKSSMINDSVIDLGMPLPMTDSFMAMADSIETTIKENNNETNWNRRSCIATICGGLLTLITIFVMIIIHIKQTKGTDKQIKALHKQNLNTIRLIKNQERASHDAMIRSNNLNSSLQKNVSDIKHYMMDKDLVIKITERKASIYKTFMFISGTSFTGSELKKGTLLQNHDAILDATIKMSRDIEIVGDLLPDKTQTFITLAQSCQDDLTSLSYNHKDVIQWIKDTQNHFSQFDSELDVLIDNIRNKAE